jgi:excisionase family DNA binding protein
MTVMELAELLRVHTSTLYRMCERGELPFFKIGSKFRFNRDQIDAWMRARSKRSQRGW